MQFEETNKTVGKCANPGCDNPVPIRSVRDVRSGKPSFCSRACAASIRYVNRRYRNPFSSKADIPTYISKTK